MTEQMRRDLTPQGYIRHIFAEIENGVFKVRYKNPENRFAEEERRLIAKTFDLSSSSLASAIT